MIEDMEDMKEVMEEGMMDMVLVDQDMVNQEDTDQDQDQQDMVDQDLVDQDMEVLDTVAQETVYQVKALDQVDMVQQAQDIQDWAQDQDIEFMFLDIILFFKSYKNESNKT